MKFVLLKFIGEDTEIFALIDRTDLHVVSGEAWDRFTDNETRDRLWERVGEGTFDEMNSLAKLVNRS